jgi:SAM-dependent methyltransferase
MRFYRLLRKMIYIPSDVIDFCTGNRDPLTPPNHKSFVYGCDFKTSGENFMSYFKDIVKLSPNAFVLDIGCGIGRSAVPLTKHLSQQGEYQGFDIIKEGINWCTSNISTKYPNFHFQLADIHNRSYHPEGKHNASSYTFPFPDNYFDFAFSVSVFTHLVTADTENYFTQISRTLKPGGKCLNTFFILNDETKKLIANNKSTLDFSYECEGYTTISKSEPEKAIAYNESYLRNLHEKNGFKILEPIHFGSWSGKSDFLSGQDIIVAQKN